jgi:hypothetical protein
MVTIVIVLIVLAVPEHVRPASNEVVPRLQVQLRQPLGHKGWKAVSGSARRGKSNRRRRRPNSVA